jgi:transcription elongation factor Elf1
MLHTGKEATDQGIIEWLTCEHCGHNQCQMDGEKYIPDVKCKKCGKTQK